MRDMLFEQQGQLGLITLNRPSALNALTLEMVKEIAGHLSVWKTSAAIKAVVIQSTSEKAFCAGGDIRHLFDSGKQGDAVHLDFFRHEYQMNELIHHYPKPYIALMHGVTMGGGVGVSLHGSHPVGSEKFLFAMPETGIGFFPDIGASFLLSRTPGYIGEYLALTGARLDSSDALYCGLIKHKVSYGHFGALIEALIKTDLTSEPAASVRLCIAEFEENKQTPYLVEHLDEINHCFSRACVEEIMSALTQLSTDWAANTYQQLSQKSPLSLKVTLSQIRRARTLTVNECLTMDYTLVQHFMAGHDFYEGVRALLIDKDKTPQWSPTDLDDVDEKTVMSYFESL